MGITEIIKDIREAISDGTYRAGDTLPAGKDLAVKYGVSRQTVSNAMSRLALLGLVNTGTRSGVKVLAGKPSDNHLGSFGAPDLAHSVARRPTRGGSESERTVEVRQVTAKNIAGIEDGTQVVERIREYRVDGLVAQHKVTILPLWVAEKKPRGYQGIAPLLAPVGAPTPDQPKGIRFYDWLGIGEVSKSTRISVDPVEGGAAAALGMSDGVPCFRIVTVTRDANGRTVDVLVQTLPLHHGITLDSH
ncbi:GntR family transcriptional regulator [Streptomyces sp. NPDC000927]|uniref:GntR family transcriptional regulator n=1 Tax=Streptomyces sp. NPDC000927 TaxID=3154371 RepID=UPI0033324E93